MIDEALEEKLDGARKARRWADVAELARALNERAHLRSEKEQREATGVVDIASRKPRR